MQQVQCFTAADKFYFMGRNQMLDHAKKEKEMNTQALKINNREKLAEKIDYLKEVTATLLEEVKLRSSLKLIEVEQGITLEEEVLNFELQLIKPALEKTKGNQKSAARLLNIKYSTFCAKVKRHNIEPNLSENDFRLQKKSARIIKKAA